MNLNQIFETAAVSHEGRKRPHNEDSSAIDRNLGLLIVADGMGGYKAGEVASAIAVTSIRDEIKKGLKSIKSGQIDQETGYSSESLLVRNAVIKANDDIYKTAQDYEFCHGMGTTLVVVLFHDNKYTVAHVGDSRVYRKRGEMFEQVTNDHSLIQELIDRGFFTSEEAHANTPKNLVTRALGIDPEVEVEIDEDVVVPGDIFLLCSDGLNDMVNDEEIHLTLSKYSDNLATAGEELVNLANEKGGKDNISVVLSRLNEKFPVKSAWYSKLFG